MEDFFKKTGWTSIITSVITSIIGIAIICNPEAIMESIAYILGIILIIFGAFKLINYFMSKGAYDFSNYEMVFGILAIVLGIVTIAYRETIVTIFRIIIGIWILYSGLMRFGLVTKLRAINVPEWKWSLIIAILILICGIYVIASSGAIGLAIGIVILFYSIMDIIEGVILLRNVDTIF